MRLDSEDAHLAMYFEERAKLYRRLCWLLAALAVTNAICAVAIFVICRRICQF